MRTRQTGRCDRTAWLISLGIVLFLRSTAHSQDSEPADNRPLPFTGRLFVCTILQMDPLAGLVAVDPNRDVWTKVSGERDQQARVSLDGKRLVVRTLGARTMRVLDVEGAKEPIAVFGDGVPCGWFPDGRHILVSSFIPPLGSGRYETWKAAADGSGKAKLPIPETELVLDLSPDGKWLLTASSRGREKEAGLYDFPLLPLYRMHPDGTEEHLVRKGSPHSDETGETINVLNPRLSPDGQKLVWGENIPPVEKPRAPRKTRVVVVNRDGSNRRVILESQEGKRYPYRPCWSPDGKALAVTVAEGELFAGQTPPVHLEIVDLAGKTIREIRLPEVQPSWRVVTDWR